MPKIKKDTLAYNNKLNYIKEYTKENYEQINLTVSKGTRERFKTLADGVGLSVSAFILHCVDLYQDVNKIEYKAK